MSAARRRKTKGAKAKHTKAKTLGDSVNTCYLCDGEIGPDDLVAHA